MRVKGLLLVGAVAGAIFASTPQGKKFVENVKENARSLWARPDVQKTVSGIQDQVRTSVPGIGDDIADAVDGIKPATSAN